MTFYWNSTFILKGIVENGEPEKGPKLFYDGTKFLMRVSSPIRVHIFSNQEGGSTIGVDLDGPADSIKGSMLTEDSYKVNIGKKSYKWDQKFTHLLIVK